MAELLAIGLLLAGTLVFVVTVALAARAVDRLWDRVEARLGDGSAGSRTISRRRRPSMAGLPRPVIAAILAGSLLFALAWATFVFGHGPGLG